MTDPQESSAPLRASDAERGRAAELLREAMTIGRLNIDELDDCMRLVYGAKTRAELERLVNDVLVPTGDRHPVARQAATVVLPGTAALRVREGGEGTRRILSILSGSLTGRTSTTATPSRRCA